MLDPLQLRVPYTIRLTHPDNSVSIRGWDIILIPDWTIPVAPAGDWSLAHQPTNSCDNTQTTIKVWITHMVDLGIDGVLWPAQLNTKGFWWQVSKTFSPVLLHHNAKVKVFIQGNHMFQRAQLFEWTLILTHNFISWDSLDLRVKLIKQSKCNTVLVICSGWGRGEKRKN